MKLTSREKILLPAAIIIIAAALFINFIYLPLNKEIYSLKAQAAANELLINESETKQKTMDSLKQQLADAQLNLESKHQDILQAWDQAELLVFVENTLASLCEKKSIDFFDGVSVQAIQAGEINIMFSSSYENLQKILSEFEQARYYNTVTLFEIREPQTADPDGTKLLEVSMNLRFYSNNLNNSYAQNYSFMDDAYGKTNIFK